jgi:biopolymer transport protein TolR
MRAVSRGAPIADINVTPFVDVMLVLVVIFMVAGPLLEQSITVALPRAATSQGVTGAGLTITLSREHVVYVNNEVVTLAELRTRLTDTPRSYAILIRADEHAYVRRLVELWDLCRELGFRETQILTSAE